MVSIHPVRLNSFGNGVISGQRLSHTEMCTIATYHSLNYTIPAICGIVKRHYNTVKKYVTLFNNEALLLRRGRPPNRRILSSHLFYAYIYRLSAACPTWTHTRLTNHINTNLNLRISCSYIAKIRRRVLRLRRKRLSHIARQRLSLRV